MKKSFEIYKDAGLACLPTKEDKSPAVKSWYGGDIGTGGIVDPNEYIKAEGIGICCGIGSGNLECLDFDNHFGDAKKTLSDWMTIEEVKDILQKYKLPINSTVTGGYHVLYRCDVVEGNQKLARKPKKSKNGLWRPDAIIETRGEGGYFCAPPTKGYKQVRNSMLNIPKISEEERDILLTASKSFNVWEDDFQKPKNDPRNYNETERVGDIYDNDPESIHEAKNALRGAGWTELANNRWRRPEKTKGVSATFGVVAENVWYPFSSNSYPFEERKGYTPFQVVCLLEHNGDFKAFAKELGERYRPVSYTDSGSPVYDKSKQPQVTNKEKEDRKRTELKKNLINSRIDTSIKIPKPPSVIEFRSDDYGDWNRVCSLGNFSCVDGKAKAKKTFLTSMINAAAVGNRPIYNRIRGVLPANKSGVLRFDTEQSDYDAYITTVRAEKMAGTSTEHFGTFDLREYNPTERCELIEFALEEWKNDIGFVIIDGIADLVWAINDEKEATRVVSLLLKWTKKYNMHIMVVIHQNKGDGFTTGHIGSYVMKKAEAIISVSSIEGNRKASKVEHKMQRGAMEFKEFTFQIDDSGMPVIIGSKGVNEASIENIHKTF